MADISAEVKKFREAIYGEEVRESMISLAEKVNKEGENTAELTKNTSKKVDEFGQEVEKNKEDLTTLRNDHSTDIESLEQNSASPIILTATGESIVLEDSAERRVQGLRIFGKSEQNGVPSQDSPIPIVSIGENGESKIFVHSTQLFDASKLRTKSAGGATVTNNGDGSFTISGSGTLTKGIQISYRIEHEDFVKLFHAGNVKVTGAMNGEFYFEIQVLSSSVGNLYIRHGTAADITKQIEAPDSYCAVMLIGNSGVNIPNITIKPMIYQDGDGTWEPYKPLQSLSLQTPNGLPGIPVTSGGNYTDSTGQQWVCDEIDLKRGVYIQRVGRFGKEYFGTIGMNDDKSNKKYNQYVVNNIRFKFIGTIDRQSKQKAYCTHLLLGNQIGPQTAHNGFWIYDEQTLVLILPKEKFPTIEFVKEWLQTSGIEILAPITPVETPLAEEILKAFKSLRTYYPNTVVTNDADAGMEQEYIADTQKYIDNKFTEMNKAVVATQKALL